MKKFPSIKKNSEYRSIYSKGNSKACGSLVMYIDDNGTDGNRLGISAGKKIGNSVVRHTFSRRIREIFRTFSNVTKNGYDMIIVARNKAKYSGYTELCEDFRKLLISHDIFTGSK